MPETNDAGGEQRAAADANHALKRAWEQLEAAAAEKARGDEVAWLERVRLVARALFSAIQQHEELAEEEGGVLPDATAKKPGLMAARNRLEHEHADMLHRAAEIEFEAERQLAAQDFNVELLRLEARVLHDILLLHMARTDSLIYEAYFQLEGGEGG